MHVLFFGLLTDVVGRRSEIAMVLAIKARLALGRGDLAAAAGFVSAAARDLHDPHAIAAHARRALQTLPVAAPATSPDPVDPA